MKTKSDWVKMVRILNETEQNSRLYMVSNSGLYMFYLSQFMQENTFYIPGCDSYAIAEAEDDTHLFVRGRFFEETAGDAYMFQAITHA